MPWRQLFVLQPHPGLGPNLDYSCTSGGGFLCFLGSVCRGKVYVYAIQVNGSFQPLQLLISIFPNIHLVSKKFFKVCLKHGKYLEKESCLVRGTVSANYASPSLGQSGYVAPCKIAWKIQKFTVTNQSVCLFWHVCKSAFPGALKQPGQHLLLYLILFNEKECTFSFDD